MAVPLRPRRGTVGASRTVTLRLTGAARPGSLTLLSRHHRTLAKIAAESAVSTRPASAGPQRRPLEVVIEAAFACRVETADSAADLRQPFDDGDSEASATLVVQPPVSRRVTVREAPTVPRRGRGHGHC